jgi:hypothetical protein
VARDWDERAEEVHDECGREHTDGEEEQRSGYLQAGVTVRASAEKSHPC